MFGAARPMRAARLAAVLAAVGLVATSGAVMAQSPSPAAAPSMEPSAGMITVSGAWARPSPMVQMAGAAYLVIANAAETDDALVSVASPAAAVVEIHETRDDGTGQMTMMPVDAIPVPAGGTVELKPGSFHIMLIELVAPLEPGATVSLTLTFASGAVVEVMAPVLEGPPMPSGSMMPTGDGSPAPSQAAM